MSTCKNCLKILVCKYNDGHNLFCKEDYKCPHFLDTSVLEKQIPKKPDLEGDGYDDNGELIYDTWICPCCEEHYEVDYDDYAYCPKCGQAIDWSNVEDLGINKLWCEEYQDYYGNSHPKYGGTLTDLRELPVGTKFFVANGCWKGEILSDNRMLVHSPTGDFIVELTDKYHSLYLG